MFVCSQLMVLVPAGVQAREPNGLAGSAAEFTYWSDV